MSEEKKAATSKAVVKRGPVKGAVEFKPSKEERPTHRERVALVEEAFDRDALKRVCEMHESEFGETYGMTRVEVEQRAPANFYYFKDNGSDVLAVAHLDTVVYSDERTANFVETEAGLVIFSGALDDRLGAYIILHLLPALGIKYDILLTVGEESGQSTASFFEPEKEYERMIEFDRGGTDVVLYQYEDTETANLVKSSGARVGSGSFSDISYLEHLEIKGFNWGVGYQDYHGPRSHAFLEDTFKMVGYYLKFHEITKGMYLPHERSPFSGRGGSYRSLWADDWQYGSFGSSKGEDASLTEEEVEIDQWWRAQDAIANGLVDTVEEFIEEEEEEEYQRRNRELGALDSESDTRVAIDLNEFEGLSASEVADLILDNPTSEEHALLQQVLAADEAGENYFGREPGGDRLP